MIILPDNKGRIIEHIGVLSQDPRNGWKNELNLVEWRDSGTKYEIRQWSPTHRKWLKGIRLRRSELERLRDALNRYFEKLDGDKNGGQNLIQNTDLHTGHRLDDVKCNK